MKGPCNAGGYKTNERSAGVHRNVLGIPHVFGSVSWRLFSFPFGTCVKHRFPNYELTSETKKANGKIKHLFFFTVPRMQPLNSPEPFRPQRSKKQILSTPLFENTTGLWSARVLRRRPRPVIISLYSVFRRRFPHPHSLLTTAIRAPYTVYHRQRRVPMTLGFSMSSENTLKIAYSLRRIKKKKSPSMWRQGVAFSKR